MEYTPILGTHGVCTHGCWRTGRLLAWAGWCCKGGGPEEGGVRPPSGLPLTGLQTLLWKPQTAVNLLDLCGFLLDGFYNGISPVYILEKNICKWMTSTELQPESANPVKLSYIALHLFGRYFYPKWLGSVRTFRRFLNMEVDLAGDLPMIDQHLA